MEINLSWDLFVIVFFTVIIAYTFIIGRNQAVKIIISTYIAILTADGIGNLIERYFLGNQPVVNTFDFSTSEGKLILMKIVIFILAIVIITTRGKFHINMSKSNSLAMCNFLQKLLFFVCKCLNKLSKSQDIQNWYNYNGCLQQ